MASQEMLLVDTMRLDTKVDEPSSTLLPKGHTKKEGCRPLPTDIRFEHNQPFAMRDGVKIRVDVFRPEQDEPVPALIIWSPYGKSGSGHLGLEGVALRAGVPQSRISGYESFEGLDPAEWVGKGFAIVNVDSRGAGDSEGDLRWWGNGEGEDGYDLIEQIAVQHWCSGRVGLAGNSWLAISQWFIAAEQPPHLNAIAPLEGLTDVLRDYIQLGGASNIAFVKMVQSILGGRQQQEDVLGMGSKFPDSGPYWDSKRADLSKIKVPAYILGSYSTNLHTDGAFRGYEEIPHDKKWLTVHSSQEWHDLYSDYRVQDLAKFFDYFLKDKQNGWDSTPPVRLTALGFNRPNSQFHYPTLPWMGPNPKKITLHMKSDQTMSQYAPQRDGSSKVLSYQADLPTMNRDEDDEKGELSFTYTFPEKTIIAGPSEVVINVSAEIQDDLDVYVMIRKADANGKILQSVNQPLSDLGVSDESQVPAVSVLKYLGPQGNLRASRRAVAPELSRPWRSTLALWGSKPVSKGQVIRLCIPLWQTGMIFDRGEKLLLKVSGHDMRLLDFEALQGSFRPFNKGKHYVHFGDSRDNMLNLYVL